MDVLPTLALPITNTLYLVLVINRSGLINRMRVREKWPITGQYSGHVTSTDQLENSIRVTWSVLRDEYYLPPGSLPPLSTLPTVLDLRLKNKQQINNKSYTLYPINVLPRWLKSGGSQAFEIILKLVHDQSKSLVIQSARPLGVLGLTWVFVCWKVLLSEKFWSDEGSEIW